MKNIFQVVFATVGTGLTYLFGGWSAMLGILIAFVILDYATGFLAAGKRGELSSEVGFNGIRRKVGIFVLVAIAHLVDLALGPGDLVRDAAIFFYIANELLSIIENTGELGVPIPDILLKAVEILRGKSKPPEEGV